MEETEVKDPDSCPGHQHWALPLSGEGIFGGQVPEEYGSSAQDVRGPSSRWQGYMSQCMKIFVILKLRRYTFNKDAQTLIVHKGEVAEEIK